MRKSRMSPFFARSLLQAELLARGFDLVGAAGNDTLNGGELYRGIYGLDGDDFLTGGSGNDVLFGEAWADQLFGGTGDDVLDGGAGNDLLFAGGNDDRLIGWCQNILLDGDLVQV